MAASLPLANASSEVCAPGSRLVTTSRLSSVNDCTTMWSGGTPPAPILSTTFSANVSVGS
jgi:hypothetical protein